MTGNNPSHSLVLCCFVMMRNESPILNPFLDQLEEFFDHCILLDHDSTDDTVDIIRQRKNNEKFSLCHLKSSGYPQAEVATYFAHSLIQNNNADYVFFLDCDEFLPFDTRADLLAQLKKHSQDTLIRFKWRNICPSQLNGDDIFSSDFYKGSNQNDFYKIAINASVSETAPKFSINQGYHSITTHNGTDPQLQEEPANHLLHIPVQSSGQIAFKLCNGHNRIAGDAVRQQKNEGWHWVTLARQLASSGGDPDVLRNLALNYPTISSDDNAVPDKLEFNFPYIKSPYSESESYIAAQAYSLIQSENDPQGVEKYSYTVTDHKGNILTTEHSGKDTEPAPIERPPQQSPPPVLFNQERFSEQFNTLIDPLFFLPTKMPPTAWGGHIPFLFVLMKILSPRTYVELGVHYGASFITACTAAKSLQIPTQLYAVDTWEGDKHAGVYEGEPIYQELKAHLEGSFDNFHLMRCLFIEARQKFKPGSIDLLHIDGLHTYDAVKNDFTTWLPAMASNGVIMFHDICVHERGFGVHQLWDELKEQFTTLEFHHSFGLGVLFLDSGDPRVKPLIDLASDPNSKRFYQDLVENIGNTIGSRVGFLTNQEDLHRLHHEVDYLRQELSEVYSSTSWRITSPVRATRRKLRGD